MSRALAKSLLGIAAGVLLSATVPAAAQDYPTQPVTIIVPYPAGSTTDIIARMVAEPLSKALGQPVLVEQKTGAGGAVGTTFLKNAPNDGYTIGLVVSGNVIQPWMKKDMNFDVRKDFVKMTLMYAGPYVLSVRPDFPAKTFAEFMDYLKQNPDRVFYGSSGTGTTTHLAGEMLTQLTGVKWKHVPFQGSPQVYAAIQSGEVQAYFDLYGSARANIKNGTIRPLAVSGETRIDALPDIPAIAETVPGFSVAAWTGFAAPLGTPKAITDRLTKELRAVLNAPDIRKKISDLGVQPGGNSPEDFDAFVLSQYDMWGKTIQAAGFTPQ
jgi:tripartite-type tricarboxylate transporter receptor subunit TctC